MVRKRATSIVKTDSTDSAGLSISAPVNLTGSSVPSVDIDSTLDSVHSDLLNSTNQAALLLGHTLAAANTEIVMGALEYYQSHREDDRYTQGVRDVSAWLNRQVPEQAARLNQNKINRLSALRDPSIVDQFFAPVADIEEVQDLED